MPIIQISQIVLRSGLSIDLPGAPTSLTPLTFSDGLLAGEMAFMTDTGRIYVGHDPQQGQPTFNRATYPYRNVEVLTENSTEALSRVVGSTIRDLGDEGFNESTLPTHVTDWASVVVPRRGEENYVYRLPFSDTVSAVVDYFVFNNGVAVKVGHLTVFYSSGENEPHVEDDATVLRRTGLLDPEAYEAAAAYGHVEFSFTVSGPLNARYLSFQYKNLTSDVLTMKFKVTRPRATYVESQPVSPNPTG